jgi:glycerol uptake facilitator-like aquaporin
MAVRQKQIRSFFPGSLCRFALGPAWTLAVALTFGSTIMVLGWATGHTSGGQINCAVTLALCIAGELPWLQATQAPLPRIYPR